MTSWDSYKLINNTIKTSSDCSAKPTINVSLRMGLWRRRMPCAHGSSLGTCRTSRTPTIRHWAHSTRAKARATCQLLPWLAETEERRTQCFQTKRQSMIHHRLQINEAWGEEILEELSEWNKKTLIRNSRSKKKRLLFMTPYDAFPHNLGFS